MSFEWLAKALKEITLEVLKYVFVWDKQVDSKGVGEDEKKLKDKIKKDGW